MSNARKLGIAAGLGCAIAALCAPLAAHADEGAGSSSSNLTFASTFAHRMPEVDRSARLLASHNAERRRLGLPELRWNRDLAAHAERWGKTLTRKGYLQHSDRRTRNGAGENLWMGTAGYWDVDGMFDMFLDERRNYRHNAFPHVSRTGNWSDVGHYTQIIWRDTQEVGCAVVTGRGNDVLVCRYWPAGNVWGARAY